MKRPFRGTYRYVALLQVVLLPLLGLGPVALSLVQSARHCVDYRDVEDRQASAAESAAPTQAHGRADSRGYGAYHRDASVTPRCDHHMVDTALPCQHHVAVAYVAKTRSAHADDVEATIVRAQDVGAHDVGVHNVGAHDVGAHRAGPHGVGPHGAGAHAMIDATEESEGDRVLQRRRCSTDEPHICACRHSGIPQPAMAGIDKYVPVAPLTSEVIETASRLSIPGSVFVSALRADVFHPPRISSGSV